MARYANRHARKKEASKPKTFKRVTGDNRPKCIRQIVDPRKK